MSDQPNAEPIPRPAAASSRRTVLRAAGLLAAAGGAAVVSACAADGDPASAPSTSAGSGSSSAPGPTSTASTASSPTSEASGSPTKSAKAPSGPSVPTSNVPVGGGVILNEADYVITQPTKGKYKAFTKICTHQGCAVAKVVVNGVIHCDCHGSEYSIKDGSVVTPPASRPLAEHEVTVSDGKVFVTG